MAVYIRDAEQPESVLPDNQGSVTALMNNALCGATSGEALVRVLQPGDALDLSQWAASQQLVYVVEGNVNVSLHEKEYEVGPGAGVFLDRQESARLAHTGPNQTRLMHIIVPPSAQSCP